VPADSEPPLIRDHEAKIHTYEAKRRRPSLPVCDGTSYRQH
jgi:hypothetical protein